jgi:opacity protein-like surface antigen
VDVEIDSGTADFALAYKLIKIPLKEGTPLEFTFSPLGGLRYQYLKQEVTLKATGPLGPANATLGTSKDWVEPFVGAELRYELTEKLAVISRADAGGFGIGSASDLTWNFVIGMDWTFKENMDLKLGYRVMDMDYSNGSGDDEFGWDGRFYGPILGLNIHF